MKKVLIEQLSKSDIRWMIANGDRQEVAAGTVLIRQQRAIETFYIVLEGAFSVTIQADSRSALASAFAVLENFVNLEEEIAQVASGEVLGELSFFNMIPSAITVKAIENSVVLAFPYQKLLARLNQNSEFASRFYHAIAILLLNRFEHLVKKFTQNRNLKIPPLQDVPLLFGELNDSDIDWMIQHSQIEECSTDTILIQSGQPVEKIYILLQGSVSVSFSEENKSSLTRLFSILETEDHINFSPGYEISKISKGEILGDTALIDARLSNYTYKALENLQLLSIKKEYLLIKLQQNPARASRFYRVIAMLLSARLQGLISRLGYGRDSYRIGQELSENLSYSDEIDLDEIDNITLGGARFNWMLQRLKVLF